MMASNCFICADRNAPYNVNLEAVNASTVKMTWSHPREFISGFHGYFVHWYRKNESRKSFNVHDPTSHVFTGLQPGQNTIASVSALLGEIHHYSNKVSVTSPPLMEDEFFLPHLWFAKLLKLTMFTRNQATSEFVCFC